MAETVAQRRHLDLAPDAGESAPVFARRVLDEVAERLYDLVTGPLSDDAEDLYYGANPHRDAEALRSTVADLVGLVNDSVALLGVISDEEWPS